MKGYGLNKKQIAFCKEYMKDWNCTQAAIRAGYSKQTASVQAVDLLKKPNVSEFIQELVDAKEYRSIVTTDRVLIEFGRIAFNDVSQALDSEGNLKPLKDWPQELKSSIASLQWDNVVRKAKDGGEEIVTKLKSVKFWDKNKALDMSARHLGMFMEDRKNPYNPLQDKIEQSSPDELIGLLHEIENKLRLVNPRTA